MEASSYLQFDYFYKRLKYMGSKAPIEVGEKHVLTLAKHISAYMPENDIVIDRFAGTLSLTCAVFKMESSATI